MKSLSQLGKKGVSEIVGYVLLIVIALALSVFVYAYLKLYAPNITPECSEDIRLVIRDYSCTCISNIDSQCQLILNITNRGLFKVQAAYVRVGSSQERVRKEITNDTSLFLASASQQALLPGNITTKLYTFVGKAGGNYTLEIQPAVFDTKNRLLACNNAIALQSISCII